MDKITKPATLSGFMELLPKEQLIFNEIKNVLEETYRLYGFVPLDTPILEYSEVLLAKAGGETEKQIYRFKKGDTDLTMRFDLTVPLAKYAALYQNELIFPFKRYQIGKSYRGERAQRGRFREFYQSDIDIIGDGELSLINDAEIPSIIYEIFSKLGITDFTVKINNRKILIGFFAMLKCENPNDIMRILDKIEKIGHEKVKNELLTLGLSDEKCAKFIEFVSTKGTNNEIIDKLRAISDGNELFETGISELNEVTEYIKAFNVPETNFSIDLSIARGLDYYTGTVYETILNKHPEIGSVCSGGRYDDLAGFYTSKKLPGVGISIGLTRLFFILNEMRYLNMEKCALLDALIIPMTDDFNSAIELVGILRQNKINSQIYFENRKFKAKINFADKIGAKYVIFIGEDEIKSNTVSLKNFITGEQISITRDEAITIIKKSKNESNKQRLIVV